MHPKGSFIYRLAGRDRQKSASYYTPQVLTQCLVKYALKELLDEKNGRVKKADDILTLTVCEPAMGSAAFLNEAVNQLAEAYLERKQAELKTRIPHDQYPQELQKVRMYLADRNVFGVDLNPVAVELAEVSIWLNAIYGEQDDNGQPLPARVPWFGYQLFAGNSLIGARHQVYNAAALKKGAKPVWHEAPPRRAIADAPRRPDEIWHFLLPDPGMGDYTDKVAKSLYPEDFARLKAWRKALTAPLCFADVLLGAGPGAAGRTGGGFDLILGNPPWLKVEWNEAGILGERNPVFAVRKISASDLAKLRAEAFAQFPGLQADWLQELEEAEGTQAFLNAVQNYPLLKGVQTNLYKCFMPLAWGLSSAHGVAGLLTPEGPYDDPNGGGLREALYQRLAAHFQLWPGEACPWF